MNYESMSDFEINKAVAVKLCVSVDAEQYEGLCDRDERVVLCHDEFDLSVGLDYCNNPSDAWPIIIENEIGINKLKCEPLWIADKGGDYVRNKNPLRAAMIVFLMMNENK